VRIVGDAAIGNAGRPARTTSALSHKVWLVHAGLPAFTIAACSRSRQMHCPACLLSAVSPAPELRVSSALRCVRRSTASSQTDLSISGERDLALLGYTLLSACKMLPALLSQKL